MVAEQRNEYPVLHTTVERYKMSTTFAVTKKKCRISCNDFFYKFNGKIKRLSEWRNIFGAQTEFTYELGCLDRIIVTDSAALNGEKVLAILTKVEN